MTSRPVPLVSVVIPAYDAAEFVGAAVASACAQTHRRIEILVADDGSTDATCAEVERLAGGDSRVRLLRGSHSGHPGVVRNRALRHARGEFIAFLDADDLWVATKLEDQLAELARNPGANFSFTSACFLDPAAPLAPLERPLPRSRAHPSLRTPEDLADRGFEMLLTRRRSIHTSGLLIARALAETVGPFSEDPRLRSAQDDDYILRAWRLGKPAPLGEVYVLARRRPSSVSAENSWANIFALLESAESREILPPRLRRRAWSAAWVVRGERERARPSGAWRLAMLHAWRLDPTNPRRIPALVSAVLPRNLAGLLYAALRRAGGEADAIPPP